MGVLLRLKCKKCGYNEVFRIGPGYLDYDKELLIREFREDVKEKAAQILNDPKEGKNWDFDRVIAQCSECGRIEVVPVLIKGSENIVSSCECGGSLHLWTSDEDMDMQKDKLPLCPGCREELSAERTGLWD